MNWQFTLYHIPLFIATVIMIGLIVYTWSRRSRMASRAFFIVLVTLVIRLVSYILEVGSTEPAGNLFWANVSYIGLTTLPVAWYAFCALYVRRTEWVTRRTLILLLIIPALILAAIWTDPAHHLFRRTIAPDVSGPVPMMSITYGPLFYIYIVYSYGLMAVGTALLVQAYVHASSLYRRQIGIVLLGAFIPWIANVLYILVLDPILPLDLTVIAFLLTGILITWGMFDFRLIDVTPLARENVIDNMEDGVIVLNSRNDVTDANPAAQEILEQSYDEIVGQPARRVFATWPDLLEQYLTAPHANSDLRLKVDSEFYFINLVINPIYDKRGLLNGRAIILRDITEQKQAEAELRAAKDAAEAANRAKSTFLATMSHELRTPLTAVLGYSELLQEEAAESENHVFIPRLQKIDMAANELLRIINDVLQLSKLEAGRMELQLETFDVAALIETTLVAVQPLVEKQQNRISVNLAPDLGTMYSDCNKVRQVLLNLLKNATKFTERGEISFSVWRSAANTETPASIIFEVKDTGIGMTSEQIDRLFQPFMQVDSSTTRPFGGAGLGLSITHQFCKLMQGDVQVASKPNEGSTFTVCLPCTLAQKE